MWIKYIKLENFASIKVGLKREKIYIDFSNRKNHICLLSGPNGIGKTSLLSTFTPFAGVGNLDVRDSEDIIISGESGYKEISIVSNNNEYVIKHFYSPVKESHSVKSYIEKNGEELNPNGNVRSFLLTVSEELGIEPNYLKLIRLGNNVTNLLQLSATDRKKFLSTLLQELDIYLNYFKKLTDDSRILKSQISHLSDQLSKTNIGSKEEGEAYIETLKNEISDLEKEKEDLTKRRGAYESELSKIDKDEILSEYNSLSKQIKKAENALSKKSNSLTIDECNKLISEAEDNIHKLNESIGALTEGISFILTDLNTIDKELNEIDTEISKRSDDGYDYFIKLKDTISELKEEIKKDSKYLSQADDLLFTKEELETLMSVCININQIMDNLYSFGKKPVEKVSKLMKQNKNVNNYINNGLMESNNDRQSTLLHKLLDGVSEIEPDCDHNSCSLYKLWIQVKNLDKEEEVKRDSEDGEEFYKYMNIIYQKTLECIDILGKYKDIITKLPESIQSEFLSKTLFNRMSKLEPIFDISKFNVLLSEITELSNLDKKKDRLKELETYYKTAEKTYDFSYFKAKKETLLEKRERSKKLLDDKRSLLSESKLDLLALNDTLDQYKAILLGLSEMDSMKERESKLYSDLLTHGELSSKRDIVINKLGVTDIKLNKVKSEYMNASQALNVFNILIKDQNKLLKLFDENLFIKRALSTKEGIPLEFINIYMGNIKTTINELLNIVYDGDLFIDDFKINADEFRIPFIRDGYLISDIKQASQGETAFLSLALSFALISESILNYNIILLDEIDGNLDDGKRKKFIAILERLIEMIQADQIFLISHNNLFSMYPVDVLSLNGEVNTEMSLANYIPIYFEF